MNGFASMPLQWIKDHLDYPHEYCLIWPFGKDNSTGRGSLNCAEVKEYAHRLMCKMVHGDPPTPEHEAAHSCGNGHLGCVNPNHLDWKTVSENHLDTAKHGRRDYSRTHVLNDVQVEEIRALQGKELQKVVAARYGVSAPTISHIWYGRTHTAVSKMNYFTKAEDDAIRSGVANGKSFPQLAKEIGRPEAAISGRAYRLGLKSGYVRVRRTASR